MISRRHLLALSIAGAGCRRKRGAGFGGYAFVANEEGEAIAAVDLTAFAVIRHIPLGGKPTAIVAHPTEPLVYALTPSTGTVHEVSSDRGLGVRRRLRIASSAISMRLSPSADALLVLCEEPKQLVRIPLDPFAVGQKVALPAVPFDFDISPDGSSAAVSLGADRSFCWPISIRGRPHGYRTAEKPGWCGFSPTAGPSCWRTRASGCCPFTTSRPEDPSPTSLSRCVRITSASSRMAVSFSSPAPVWTRW